MGLRFPALSVLLMLAVSGAAIMFGDVPVIAQAAPPAAVQDVQPGPVWPTLTPAQAALAWVVQQPGVTTVIPGARNVSQASSNAAAGSVGELPASFLDEVRDLYERRIRDQVHARW